MATHLVGTCAGEVEGSARSVFVVSRTYLLFFQGVTIFRISLRRVNADAGLLSRLDLGRILFCLCGQLCRRATHERRGCYMEGHRDGTAARSTGEGGVAWIYLYRGGGAQMSPSYIPASLLGR